MNLTDQATSNFGVKAGHFSFGNVPDVRADIPQNQVNRSNARSMGRRTYQHSKTCNCGSNYRNTWTNKCAGCN